MNKIGILDIIEALSVGYGFNSIAVPDFHPKYNDYYVNRSYAVFEVKIERIPYTLLVLLNPDNNTSKKLIQTLRVIEKQKLKIPFTSCRYLQEEFQPIDKPEVKCDVILIQQEEGDAIYSVVKANNESLALLDRIGEILHQIDSANLIIDNLFDHLIVSPSGTIKIQVSDRLKIEYKNNCSDEQKKHYARKNAFNLFFLWCKTLHINMDTEDIDFAHYALDQNNNYQELFDRMTKYNYKTTSVYDMDLSAFARTVLNGEPEETKELIQTLQTKVQQIYLKSHQVFYKPELTNNRTIDYLNTKQYTLSLVHNENRIAIMQNDCGLWGYIDYYGTVIINFKYHAANDFYDGYAIVMLDEKIGVINKFGEQIVPLEFDEVEWIGFDQIFRVVKNKECILLNKNGQRISACYKRIGPFIDGVAMVETEENRMGFISNQGKVIIPPRYLNVTPFDNGVAMALGEDGIWYRISRLGQVLD